MTQPTPAGKGRGPVDSGLRENVAVSSPDSSAAVRQYGLAPQLRARLMGLALVAIAVLLVVGMVVVGVLGLPQDLMTVLVVLVVVGVFGLGFLLVRGWYVVRLDAQGYQVRFVRGAGTTAARWSEVEDLVTTQVAGADAVVLRLKDGRSTTIPVAAIEGDQEEFVDALLDHLPAEGGRRRTR